MSPGAAASIRMAHLRALGKLELVRVPVEGLVPLERAAPRPRPPSPAGLRRRAARGRPRPPLSTILELAVVRAFRDAIGGAVR